MKRLDGKLITKLGGSFDYNKDYRGTHVFVNVYNDGETWCLNVFRYSHGCEKTDCGSNWSKESALEIALDFMNGGSKAFAFTRGCAPNF